MLVHNRRSIPRRHTWWRRRREYPAWKRCVRCNQQQHRTWAQMEAKRSAETLQLYLYCLGYHTPYNCGNYNRHSYFPSVSNSMQDRSRNLYRISIIGKHTIIESRRADCGVGSENWKRFGAKTKKKNSDRCINYSGSTKSFLSPSEK